VNKALRRLTAGLVGLVFVSSCTAQSPPHTPEPVFDDVALRQRVEDFIGAETVSVDSVRAVLVVVDGQTKLEYYRHGFAAGDHEHVWSVTQSVVASLIGIALGDGLIPSLDSPLRDLLPEYRPKMKAMAAGATLRQLMNHTAGFVKDMPTRFGQKDFTGGIDPVAWALSVDESQATTPGSAFWYSNLGAHLAAAVLYSALQHHPATKGQSVLDYARTRLFDPLGIGTRPAFEVTSRSLTDFEFAGPGFGWAKAQGVELGGIGLRLTAPDMAKLGQLYLNDGIWDGKRLLPEGWVAEVTAPSPLTSSYGLLWWRMQDGGFAAAGHKGQRIVVVPSRRAVIVTLCATQGDYPLDEIDRLIGTVLLPALG
jgi:CubicO group peptidase (beta-lactamase class C family)